MTTYQEYARQFAGYLSVAPGASTNGMLPGLQVLIDAMPYYGNHEFQTIHRGALANLLEVYLPNDPIASQGNESGFGWNAFYQYTGPHPGYRDAFYGGIPLSAAAANLAAVVQATKGNLNNEFWGNYGVTVLTDAIKQTVGGNLNTGKLSTDLTNNNNAFLPTLSASYYAIFSHDFSPTVNALNALKTSGQTAQANTDLVAHISSGQFTANINQALVTPGDSAAMAVWFLFNLWVTLKALDNPNIDGAIRQFQAAGLKVPPQVGADNVGPGNWWSGGYTSWWSQLSGSDVVEAARGTIQTVMPQRKQTGQSVSSHGGYSAPAISDGAASNGYCWSFINWGKLNWYDPSRTSCFGRGTGVLMADGSVKAIEQVKRGDEVQSSDGPQKVLLIVTPLRGGRPLYGLNRLNLSFTAGHPFRTPGELGPARAAIDAWAVIDSVATMTEQGVATLMPGSRLSARGTNGAEVVTVAQLDEFEAASGSDELLYDLVLERGEAGVSCYYVGGPDVFLATDTEWPDPLHEPATTNAIITAMKTALPICRASQKASVTQLPDIFNLIQLGVALPKARAVALSAPEEMQAHSEFDLDFFIHEGEWDPHASALGNNLVRRFARTIRRETAMGWRVSSTLPQPDDQLTVAVHDVQLLGDVSIGSNAKLRVELRLRGWNSSEDTVRELEMKLGERPIWHITLDEVVEFGRAAQTSGSASLLGSVTLDDRKVGEFLATITVEALAEGTVEYFLFGGDGKVVGRIALEPRTSSDQDLIQEREQRKAWASHHTTALAMNLGSEIVRQIITHTNQ